jgi:hypothetical protein
MPTKTFTSLISQKAFEPEALDIIYASKKAMVRENLLLADTFDSIKERRNRAIKRKIEATAEISLYYANHSPVRTDFTLPNETSVSTVDAATEDEA